MPADTDGSWRSAAPVPFKPGKVVDKRGKNPIDDKRGLFVIHAAHLHTGKVLWFCGHTEFLDYPLVSFLFDPRKPNAPAVPKAFPGKADLFCCHYVQLADGRILVVGGSQLDHVPAVGTRWDPQRDYRGSAGASTIAIFDPRKEAWEPVDTTRKLSQGRWYPTVALLGDGSVLVVSGRRETPEPGWSNAQLGDWLTNRGIADKVEHLSPPNYKPRTVTGANRAIPIYPGIHLAPDDRLYTTHTTWGQEIDEPPTLSLTIVPPAPGSAAGTPASGTWTEYVLPTAKAKQPEREEGMSVMLPVVLDPVTKQRKADSVGRYLVVGGGFAVDSAKVSPVRREVRNPAPPFAVITPGGQGTSAFHHQEIATPTDAEILDTNIQGAPRWFPADGAASPTTRLKHKRINGHCLLLPDATVLVLGGHDNYKWNSTSSTTDAAANSVPLTNPTLPVEIYTPGTGFRVGASMAHPRMYHSIAMLLVDGSVVVAGGADPNEHEPSLRFPATWEGRSYIGTARRVEDAATGDTSLQVDTTTPSPDRASFADMPIGTKVIIDPGPNQIETTIAGFNTVPGVSNELQILEIATPLPRDIVFGTRVDFAAPNPATPILRRNEWLTMAGGTSVHTAFSTPLNRKDFEIYQPPYFHLAGTRPVLPALKAGEVQVKYGATFTIRTPDASRITRVAIMRPAAVTHHTDTEQRFIELPFQASGTDALKIDMVPGTDSSLVPPGYYMLWILAGQLPCVEARFIQLVGAPPLRSPTVPSEVAPPAPPPPPPPPPAPPPASSTSSCPIAALATTVVAVAQVAYLRGLRTELGAAPAGERFVRALERPYSRAGTPLARWLSSRARWRAAARDVVLRPLTGAVIVAERLSRRRADRALRRGRLIALLSLVGLGSVALAPVAVFASWLHVAVHRLTAGRQGAQGEGGDG